jgi:nickel/cobalt exporter
VILTAAGVGFAHAVLLDHWVALAVLGRTHSYPPSRIARLSLLATVAHVLASLLLDRLIVAIELQLRSSVEYAQQAIVGGLLAAAGVAFGPFELSGRGRGHTHKHDHHHYHDHSHDHGGGEQRLRGLMVPFSAAASPDLTILPVFLAATAARTLTAIGSLIAFAALTIATVVALALGAALTGYRVKGQWLKRRSGAITAVVLVVIGVLVLIGKL